MEEEEAAVDLLQVVAEVAVVVEVAVAVAVEEEALPQPLALLHMVMKDQTEDSKGTPPLSLTGIIPRANNS